MLSGHFSSASLFKFETESKMQKNLKISGSKPSGGRDVAELGSVMVRRASRLFMLFLFFLILVVEDVVWSSILLPHTCLLLSCMHSMVETKTYPENIYRQK
jgi:hypothetical protein